jgi:hypothetical protein
MARFKRSHYLHLDTSPHFDLIHAPGAQPPDQGIYVCVGCLREVVVRRQDSLPEVDHHSHENGSPVGWRLAVGSVAA